MSIYRKAAKRDANEPEIVQALEGMGALVERTDKPLDLIVNVLGVIALADVKDPKRGRLTPAQVEFLDQWAGAPIYVLKTTDDAVRMVNELRALAGRRAA